MERFPLTLTLPLKGGGDRKKGLAFYAVMCGHA
jgi:hypothetical protein